MSKSGRQALTINADLAGLDDYMDALADNAEAAARPAAQAAVQVLYNRIRMNVAGMGRVSGNLYDSIYQAFSAANSSPGHAVYHTSWNPRKAPHGHLLEWGWFMRYRYYRGGDGQIRPMVRPGMDGKRPPSRHAGPEAMAAYYVPLPSPVHVPGRAFVRSAAADIDAAYKAAEETLLTHILWKAAS